MHDLQNELPQTNEKEPQGIDLCAAYKVLVRALYRLECRDRIEEEDHGKKTI